MNDGNAQLPPSARHHTAAKKPASASARSAGAGTRAAGTAAFFPADGAMDDAAPLLLPPADGPPADGPPASGARAGESAGPPAAALLPASTSLLLDARLSAPKACLSGLPPLTEDPTCHTWFTAFVPLGSCSLPYTRILPPPPAASAARSVAGKSSLAVAGPSA
ncbi:hypothetical protein BS78_07G197500 [Paspalum vaginatum]|nr:hypothetical protein BS78_07G197500 [Paspalum vaginatum]